MVSWAKTHTQNNSRRTTGVSSVNLANFIPYLPRAHPVYEARTAQRVGMQPRLLPHCHRTTASTIASTVTNAKIVSGLFTAGSSGTLSVTGLATFREKIVAPKERRRLVRLRW